ncbi:hypothetical protein E4T56_gene597 [Termitomyces sp. T112]|nr:hypothetical protein E4T56_gene597 [Termitomyces sp. T112]
MGPRVPRPPFPTNSPHPLPAPMLNPPADANYFGPPTSGGPPPPQWAPGNAGQPPNGGPPNSGPPGGWSPAMDNFPPLAWKQKQLLLLLQHQTPALSSKLTERYSRHTGPGRKQVGGLGLEDTLNHEPDPDIFSTPATLLRAMILAPDNLPAHLPSHSSTNLLLCTTLPFTNNPVPTLVNSSATDNFIDEFLAALTPHPLQCLPTLIPLKLFDGDPTPVGDITYCLEMTMTFANRQQQEL